MIIYRPRAVVLLLLRTTCREWIIKITQINGENNNKPPFYQKVIPLCWRISMAGA